jgi:hypothetical protein
MGVLLGFDMYDGLHVSHACVYLYTCNVNQFDVEWPDVNTIWSVQSDTEFRNLDGGWELKEIKRYLIDTASKDETECITFLPIFSRIGCKHGNCYFCLVYAEPVYSLDIETLVQMQGYIGHETISEYKYKSILAIEKLEPELLVLCEMISRNQDNNVIDLDVRTKVYILTTDPNFSRDKIPDPWR